LENSAPKKSLAKVFFMPAEAITKIFRDLTRWLTPDRRRGSNHITSRKVRPDAHRNCESFRENNLSIGEASPSRREDFFKSEFKLSLAPSRANVLETAKAERHTLTPASPHCERCDLCAGLRRYFFPLIPTRQLTQKSQLKSGSTLSTLGW